MKKNRIYISTLVLFLFFAINSFSQQNNTLYFMHQIPQANLINPSIQHSCKLNFSGIILPVAGQVLPPLHLNIGSTGFTYNQVLPWDDSIDSLIHPMHPHFDKDKFVNRLKNVNYISLATQINILSVGYKWKKDYYFTFSVYDKFDFKFSLPKDMIKFGYEGNGGESFLGNKMDWTGFGFSSTYWREYALGASKLINPKLTLGVNAKLLFGKLNAWTRNSTFTWFTDENDYAYAMDVDWEVNSSQPFYGINKLEYDYDNDSLIFEEDTLWEEPDIVKDVIMNGKNIGLGIDIGASYQYSDKINLYGSIIDLGFIRWKDNPQTLRVNGTLLFDGYDVTHYLQENDSLNEEIQDQRTDSIINLFQSQYQVDKYTSYLNPKIYLGGTYKLNDMFTVGAHLRGELFQHTFHTSMTASGQANVKKWFSASLSYSYLNNSFNNIGAGIVLKGGPAQFFIVTDNVVGVIWPQSTRNVNIRLGVNMIFGCKKDSKAMLF